MLTTVRVKEGQKPSKTLNWRHCSITIRAKRKKRLLLHWKLPTKSFLSDCMRWELFKNKEFGFFMIWNQGTLSVVFSPVNNCFNGKKEGFSLSHRGRWWKMDSLFIISCWIRMKPSLGNGIERNWCVWAEHCAKNGHNTSRGTKKWFYSMTTPGLTLPNPLKPPWTLADPVERTVREYSDCSLTVFSDHTLTSHYYG